MSLELLGIVQGELHTVDALVGCRTVLATSASSSCLREALAHC
jgi:hypothetical protein